MHSIRGQALPGTFLEHPSEMGKKNSGSSHTDQLNDNTGGSMPKKSPALRPWSSHPSSHDAEGTKAKVGKEKKDKHVKDKDNSTSLMSTTSFLGRQRSGSATSQQSNKSSNHGSASLLPSLLVRRNSLDNSNHAHAQTQAQATLAAAPSTSHHHHIRLPSIFKKRKHSSAASTSLEPTSTSPSPSSSSSALPIPSLHLPQQQHTIIMVPQHDIHITWPHPVPSGNVCIAGTWSVPGQHGPWEKLPMTRIQGTDSYEIHLNVQEEEDISDYLDEEGYLHHELLEHHHAHDRSFQEHQQQQHSSSSTPSTPNSTPPATLSRRKRLYRRFFGRSRSSSTASNAASAAQSSQPTPRDLHLDLPYHHQTKDGIIVPLTREYRYQYKFVIDGEWKCDPTMPEVRDKEGHWNHELIVDLIEQIHQQTPSSSGLASANRSRSSSLQSQHSVHGASEILPTAAVSTLPSILTVHEEEIIPSEDTQAAPLVPATTASDDADPAIPAASTLPSSPSQPIAPRSKDTYEAVLIVDERDDMSDGEGGARSRRRSINNIVIKDAQAKSDDELTHIVAPQQEQEGQQIEQHQQQPQHAQEAGKDEDDHAAAPLVDQDEHNLEAAAAVLSVVAPASNEVATDHETYADAKSSSVLDQVEEDVFVSSSSVAEPLPELGEHSIIVPAQEPSSEEKQEVKTEDVPVEAVAIVTEATQAPTEEDVEIDTAIENTAVVAKREPEPELKVKSVPEPFVLQAAANPDDHHMAPSSATPQLHRSSSGILRASRAPLEVVTDSILASGLTAATISGTGVTGAAASYSQVPSPPLTPSNPTAAHKNDSTTREEEDEEEEEVEISVDDNELFSNSSMLLTPRSEAPLYKLTIHRDAVQEQEETQVIDEHKDETFDALNEHQPSTTSIPLSLSFPSSACLKDKLSTDAIKEKEKEEGETKDQKRSAAEMTRKESENPKELPDSYPNLLWSVCKTTVVVSAAVVVIGLGLGRRRD